MTRQPRVPERFRPAVGTAAVTLALVTLGVATGAVRTDPGLGPPTPAAFAHDLPGEGYSVDGLEQVLTVHWLGGEPTCAPVVELGIDETDDAVLLTLVERRVERDRYCAPAGHAYERTVTLDAPLGDRRVVDTTSGAVLAPVTATPGTR